jgi:hypothetical protein
MNEVQRKMEREIQAKRMECIVQEAFNAIKKEIETCGENHIYYDLMVQPFMKIFGADRDWQLTDAQRDMIEDCLPMVKEAFENFGYAVTFHTFSKSWRKKSGKVASVSVDY